MPTLKQAASELRDAYAEKLKDIKNLSITHKSFEGGAVIASISGPVADVRRAYTALSLTTGLPVEHPDHATIHSLRSEIHDGPKADKEADQTQTITLHHVLTTY